MVPTGFTFYLFGMDFNEIFFRPIKDKSGGEHMYNVSMLPIILIRRAERKVFHCLLHNLPIA